MANDSTPRRRTSLTKKQIETELGAELLSLCQTVTADGQLTTQEVADLRAWIEEHSAHEIPAIQHLRDVLDRVLADGKVTADEMRLLHTAVEAVLPPELRKAATSARRERERDERDRDSPIGQANFMVAGVRHEGRAATIRAYVRVGDPAILRRDPANPYSRHSIAVYTASGHQIGFMPDDEARDWASDLDNGTQVRATFTKILTGGRAPIPIVDAKFYGQSARLPSEDAASPGVVGSLARVVRHGHVPPIWVAGAIIVIVFMVSRCS